MNKTTLKLLLFLSFFVNQIYAQVGTSCANPIQIVNIPYTTQDDTANYMDLVEGLPGSSGCGTSNEFLSGNDVFYKIIPSNTNPITITSLTNTTWSGLFVFNSCANVGVSCVIGSTSGNGTTIPDSVTFIPTIGQEYFIVISTWAAPQTASYELTVVENTCTNMNASFSVTSNCANVTDTFFVTATVTDMGSATSILGTTYPSSTSQTLTSTGELQFGPFDNGTNVIVNLQNQQDTNCFKNSTSLTQLYCPATNDLCANAIPINCNSTITGSTVGATTAGALTTSCGTTSGSGGLWYSFTGNGDLVNFSLCNSSFDTKIQVVTGSCGNFVCVNGNDDSCGSQSQIQIQSIQNEQYYIYVYGYGTAQGEFILATTCSTPPPPPTNDEYQNAISIPVSTTNNCPQTTSASTLGATPSLDQNACTGTANDDVWYQFTATGENVMITYSNINFFGITNSTALITSAYELSNNQLSPIACNNTNEYILSNLTIGNTYKLRIYTSQSSTNVFAMFSICIKNTNNQPITISTLQTNQQLVENLLDNNPCVTISNVTSSTGTNFGSLNGIGSFTNTNLHLPVQSGLILSTGNVNSASGFNTSTLSEGTSAWTGDTELEQIVLAGTGDIMNSHNASMLEFDFTAQHELLSFNFLFVSEEYGTYQCTFADAFAFILTDLTTGIKTNLAVIPGTTDPVSVITIRDMLYNTGCQSVNPFYFDKYNLGGTNQYLTPINFNGQAKLLTASSAIIPNNPYHIKLVIADRADNAFDSAVFIENGSFISGPIQCTENLEFIAFLDTNNNGTKDIDEDFFTNGEFVFDLNNSGVNTNVVSPLGRYKLYPNNATDLYDVSYLINSQYTSYLTSSITYDDISIANSSSSNVYYFPISVTNPYSDVSIDIVGITQPRPGFTYKNRIIYKNNGVSSTSGTIDFIKDNNITITSISNGSATTNATGFSLNYTNLLPQETRYVDVIMSVPNIPIVNLGAILTNQANVTSSITDVDLLNNSSSLNQIVVGSYDPNDKLEAHGESIDINSFTNDDYLYYTIRFQNTGSANAINIKVEDILDTQLDASSLRMISSSHNYTLVREQNQLTWDFIAINLPSVLQSEELSQGFVSFKIKPFPGYTVSDMIPNTAEIYFDSNPAIITNTFETTFVNALSNENFLLNEILIHPNPTNDILNINYGTSSMEIKSIEVHDMLGKVVYQNQSKVERIDLSNFNSGIYLLTITTEENGKMTKKLIKN